MIDAIFTWGVAPLGAFHTTVRFPDGGGGHEMVRLRQGSGAPGAIPSNFQKFQEIPGPNWGRPEMRTLTANIDISGGRRP